MALSGLARCGVSFFSCLIKIMINIWTICFNRLESTLRKKQWTLLVKVLKNRQRIIQESHPIFLNEGPSSQEISFTIEDDSSSRNQRRIFSGSICVLLSDASSILSAAGDLDLDQSIDILVNQSDLDETIPMDRWINTNEIMKTMQDRYTQWTRRKIQF